MYQVVFLDLAKAFNTVTHESIKKALWGKGVPTEVIKGVMEMYKGATRSQEVNINAGVKQGCPLSPLLFNIIMDELIERAKQRKVGIKVGKEVVGVMAFADDLVLLAEDPGDMSILLKCCENFDKKGLSVNSTQWASLKVLTVK